LTLDATRETHRKREREREREREENRRRILRGSPSRGDCQGQLLPLIIIIMIMIMIIIITITTIIRRAVHRGKRPRGEIRATRMNTCE